MFYWIYLMSVKWECCVYSVERFEKDAVSVSKFIGFVWTEAKADSGKKKNTPFQKYPDLCAFTGLFLCVPGLSLMWILTIWGIEFTHRFKFVKEKKRFHLEWSHFIGIRTAFWCEWGCIKLTKARKSDGESSAIDEWHSRKSSRFNFFKQR